MNDTDFINKEMFLKCACFMRKCNVRKGKKNGKCKRNSEYFLNSRSGIKGQKSENHVILANSLAFPSAVLLYIGHDLILLKHSAPGFSFGNFLCYK